MFLWFVRCETSLLHFGIFQLCRPLLLKLTGHEMLNDEGGFILNWFDFDFYFHVSLITIRLLIFPPLFPINKCRGCFLFD